MKSISNNKMMSHAYSMWLHRMPSSIESSCHVICILLYQSLQLNITNIIWMGQLLICLCITLSLLTDLFPNDVNIMSSVMYTAVAKELCQACRLDLCCDYTKMLQQYKGYQSPGMTRGLLLIQFSFSLSYQPKQQWECRCAGCSPFQAKCWAES